MKDEAAYQPTERSPIAARSWPIWRHAATGMARRGVSLNGISLSSMVCGIGAGGFLTAIRRLVRIAANSRRVKP